MAYVLIVCNLLGQVLADLGVLVCQYLLAVDESGVSLLGTWERLLKAGEHHAPRLCICECEPPKQPATTGPLPGPTPHLFGFSAEQITGCIVATTAMSFSRLHFEAYALGFATELIN